MAYIDDIDLHFLSECTSDELEPLVLCLTKDKKGKKRFLETLTKNPKYKQYHPLHYVYWKEIAEEIQRCGANSFVTYVVRFGDGVLYREILIDVCTRLKVNFNKDSKTSIIESNLLAKILTDTLEKLPEDEVKKVAKELGVKNATNLAPQAMIIAMQQTFLAGGFMSYQLAVIIANSVAKAAIGQGLAFAGNAGLVKGLAFLVGPIAVTISSLWLFQGIASPAYRKTIPAVIHVACLRYTKMNSKYKLI
ncbi:TPA: DUF3944 domain-containing protein [Providencia stuartii]